MFRMEFLDTVWNLGIVEAEELAVLLNTTTELILSEAEHCAGNGLIKIRDTLILATASTKLHREEAV